MAVSIGLIETKSDITVFYVMKIILNKVFFGAEKVLKDV